MTPDEKKAYHKAYYQRNKSKWRPSKIWANANPEKNRQAKAAYKAKHKDRIKAYNKAWAQKNAGKVTDYSRAYQLGKSVQCLNGCLLKTDKP